MMKNRNQVKLVYYIPVTHGSQHKNAFPPLTPSDNLRGQQLCEQWEHKKLGCFASRKTLSSYNQPSLFLESFENPSFNLPVKSENIFVRIKVESLFSKTKKISQQNLMKN